MSNDVQLSGWFYLSFADSEGFHGGVIVKASNFIDAHLEVGMLKLNPYKGSCIGAPIPEGFLPEPSFRNKLLTKEEILTFWPDADHISNIEEGYPQE